MGDDEVLQPGIGRMTVDNDTSDVEPTGRTAEVLGKCTPSHSARLGSGSLGRRC